MSSVCNFRQLSSSHLLDCKRRRTAPLLTRGTPRAKGITHLLDGGPIRIPRAAFAALLIGFTLFFPAGCEKKQAKAPPPPPKVTVSQPAREPVTDYLELNGNTQAINTVQLPRPRRRIS